MPDPIPRRLRESDIKGQKFGKLIAIERDFSKKGRTFWTFKCECGNVKSIFKYDVIKGKTNTCGCINQKTITRLNNIKLKMIGKKFHKLTIIDFAYIKQSNSHWKCKCECGKECIMPAYSLKSNNTTSCGCYRILKSKPGESGLKRLYNIYIYKTGAKRNKRKFECTLEEFKEITSKNCIYCGTEPLATLTTRNTKDIKLRAYTTYRYNGIDRIDNNRGYEKDNIVPCCKWCNITKRERTMEEFKDHIIRMYNHLKLYHKELKCA